MPPFISLSMDLIIMSDENEGLFLTRASLHREVEIKTERYEKQWNEFDVAEGFPMECQSRQNVNKLQVI